jgi:hypothetical protein
MRREAFLKSENCNLDNVSIKMESFAVTKAHFLRSEADSTGVR